MKNDDFDKVFRALGYVDSGLCGSRGDYFILSYRPGSRKKHRLMSGLVEVHSCHTMKVFEIRSPAGTFSGKDALERAHAALTATTC